MKPNVAPNHLANSPAPMHSTSASSSHAGLAVHSSAAHAPLLFSTGTCTSPSDLEPLDLTWLMRRRICEKLLCRGHDLHFHYER